MKRYQLKDKPIYLETLEVIAVGEIQSEQVPEIEVDLPTTTCSWVDKTPMMFLPWRTITLENGQIVPTLVSDLPDVKIGDAVKYDVTTDKYIVFNPNAYSNIWQLD
jgi:hypothetical protein